MHVDLRASRRALPSTDEIKVRPKAVGDLAFGRHLTFGQVGYGPVDAPQGGPRLPVQDAIDELSALLGKFERAEIEVDALETYLADHQSLRSSRSEGDGFLVDGHAATFWKSDGARSHAGLLYFSAEGVERVLKMTSPVGSGVLPYDFLREVLFGMCASLVGGPRLLAFGRIEHQGRSRLFIEMDEQFPGQPSITLKRAARKAPEEMMTEYLSQPAVRGRIVDGIARLFMRVLEAGLVPKDPDFIISRDGAVAWLDPADWSFAESPRETLAMLNYLATMTCRFGRLQSEIVEAFRGKALGSASLTQDAKAEVAKMFPVRR